MRWAGGGELVWSRRPRGPRRATRPGSASGTPRTAPPAHELSVIGWA